MALKALLLRSRLDSKNMRLKELRGKDEEFQKREEEIEAAIEEMTEDTSDEERQEVEKKAEEFEEEKKGHEEEKSALEKEIGEIEGELLEEEKRSRATAEREERKGEKMPENRSKFFGMTMQERDRFFADEGVKNLISEVRTCIREKRALANVGLTIPDIVLPLIKQVASEHSKMMKYVTVRPVSGTTRQNIMGEIPEAYWDEMCAAIKEMDLAFYNMEMDGYKVSGFFAVCNSILEDNDVNLVTELIMAIGKAIGKALDKAILYGKGVKMPMGIVTSITMAEAPSGYLDTERKWEDLSVSHVITIEDTKGIALFKEIVKASGIVDNEYNTEELVWCMNKRTHTDIMAESMDANQAAAIVAGMGNTMPVIGGNIEEFKYIPDGVIIFGYGKNYTLAERAKTVLSQSDQVRFIEDQTVFKGTARYDGKPAIREAFGILGIGSAPNITAPKFAGEK